MSRLLEGLKVITYSLKVSLLFEIGHSVFILRKSESLQSFLIVTDLKFATDSQFNLVLDSGYHVPGRYMGRVPMGMGPGPNLFTCLETRTHEYLYPHIHGRLA